MLRVGFALVLMVGSSACSSGIGGSEALRVSTPAASPIQPMPSRQENTDAAAIIGASAQVLIQRFGPPRLSVIEGEARKLQFASEQCALDIYLYPQSSNADPIATHIEARERRTGMETEIEACAAQIGPTNS